MRFERITIENFKSLGSENNSIFMSSDIIALVGKNESGKSNILAALNGLAFFNQSHTNIFNNANRYIEDAQVKIIVQVKIAPKDYLQLSSEIALPETEETIDFVFYQVAHDSIFMDFIPHNDSDTDTYFSKILRSNEKLATFFERVRGKLNTDRSTHGNDEAHFCALKHWANHWDKTYWRITRLEWLRRYTNTFTDDEIRDIHQTYNEICTAFWAIMPSIVCYKEETVDDVYKRDSLRQSFNNNNFPQGLRTLLGTLNVSPEDFMNALNDSQRDSVRSIRRRIQREAEKFSEEFNQFYNNTKEQILLSITCDVGQAVVSISRTDEDEAFKLSERSQGLRWYLVFFAALRNAKACKNSLVLIDEPAIHLHVDAQKEVLALFESLQENGIQIIYTTHNPSMLDTNSWECIRTIEKVDNISNIHPLTESHKGIKNIETLSPVQKAMGCCLKNTLAPERNQKNIIVEGITDYYYLKAMLPISETDIKDNFYLIPACGAANIPNIVSIFAGWGYDFCVLLDNDNAGRETAKALERLEKLTENKVFFVSDETDSTVESLLSEKVRGQVAQYDSDGKLQKSVTALRFLRAVESENIDLDTETKSNFGALFEKLKNECE